MESNFLIIFSEQWSFPISVVVVSPLESFPRVFVLGIFKRRESLRGLALPLRIVVLRGLVGFLPVPLANYPRLITAPVLI